jgi:hypothetical protein
MTDCAAYSFPAICWRFAHVFRQPKTDKGRRLIALTPSTVLVLKEHKEKQMVEKLLLNASLKDDDLVFS